ncbi:MAG: hypothetical protein MI700_02830 [Balneolales bacterium]|nr:hypothetical protein [Balneolales bacterium]
MRKIIPVLLFVSLGCSATSPFSGFEGSVNHYAENVAVRSYSNWFSTNAVETVVEGNFVDEKGDYFLNVVIDNYPSQTTGLKESEDSNSGISFRVKSLEVKNAFTLNIPDPGPVYKLNMEVDIFENGEFVESKAIKARVNMASIVNEDKIFNWLTAEEKNDINNQLLTFEIGLTRLYQKLYFSHFDINLHRF